MMRFIFIVFFVFVAMEFVSYLVHRFVYHGFLWLIHKSHHTKRDGPFELNDLFPLVFASITMVLIFTGLESREGRDLVAAGIGMTLYGFVYFFIHDLYVHRRAKWLRFRSPLLMKIKKAHAVHHRHGGEPYGLLLFFPLSQASVENIAEDEEV